MSIPMKCPNGHLFMSRAFVVQNGRNNTFIDNAEPCIVCGALAYNLNGTYSHADGQITSVKSMQPNDVVLLLQLLDAIRHSTPTPAKSAELKSVVQKVESGLLDDEQTQDALTAINPALAKFYAAAREHSWSIAIIISLIVFAYQIYDSKKLALKPMQTL